MSKKHLKSKEKFDSAPSGSAKLEATNTNSKSDGLISTKKSWWFPFLTFFVGTLAMALAGYFATARMFFDFKVNGEPSYALGIYPIIYISAIMLVFLASATYLMWKVASRDANEQNTNRLNLKNNLRVNLIIYYSALFLFCIFPMLFFALKITLAGVICLGVSCLAFAFLCARYFFDNLLAGILCLAWTLWEMYIFALAIAYFLVPLA